MAEQRGQQVGPPKNKYKTWQNCQNQIFQGSRNRLRANNKLRIVYFWKASRTLGTNSVRVWPSCLGLLPSPSPNPPHHHTSFMRAGLAEKPGADLICSRGWRQTLRNGGVIRDRSRTLESKWGPGTSAGLQSWPCLRKPGTSQQYNKENLGIREPQRRWICSPHTPGWCGKYAPRQGDPKGPGESQSQGWLESCLNFFFLMSIRSQKSGLKNKSINIKSLKTIVILGGICWLLTVCQALF